MKMLIIIFASVVLLGVAWVLLTQAGLLPKFSFPINIFDKESVMEWVSQKIREISELIGYEPGAL